MDPLYDEGPALADVGDVPAFRAWRLRALDPTSFAALSPRDRLRWLAGWGVLAPTSHNTVPQRFVLDELAGAITVLCDRAFVLPASDATGRQAVVSLGCVVENVVGAAQVVGWGARVEVLPVPRARVTPAKDGEPRLVPVARVTFVDAGAPTRPAAWLDAMRARRMVRSQYDERETLAADLEARLQALVTAEHPSVRLHLMADAPSRLFLGKFQELADSTVFNRDAFAVELGEWMLENGSAAARGMRGREFGLDDAAAARIGRGLRREGPLLPDEVAAFAKMGNLGFRTATAVAVLTIDEDDVPGWLAAGRAYEGLALTLGREGYVCAMHAGLCEVEPPNMALRGRLRTRARPTVVFRFGKPLRPDDALRPHASRPLVDEILEDM